MPSGTRSFLVVPSDAVGARLFTIWHSLVPSGHYLIPPSTHKHHLILTGTIWYTLTPTGTTWHPLHHLAPLGTTCFFIPLRPKLPVRDTSLLAIISENMHDIEKVSKAKMSCIQQQNNILKGFFDIPVKT